LESVIFDFYGCLANYITLFFITTQAWAQAQGLGFEGYEAQPKPNSSPLHGLGFTGLGWAWLGLASGLKPSPAHH
jgi:hypothetical protein